MSARSIATVAFGFSAFPEHHTRWGHPACRKLRNGWHFKHTRFSCQGWPAMKRRINSLIQSLVLVRFGQELGTDSEIAQAVAHSIDFLVSTVARFLS